MLFCGAGGNLGSLTVITFNRAISGSFCLNGQISLGNILNPEMPLIHHSVSVSVNVKQSHNCLTYLNKVHLCSIQHSNVLTI